MTDKKVKARVVVLGAWDLQRVPSEAHLLRECVAQKKPQDVILGVAAILSEDDWVLNDKDGE